MIDNMESVLPPPNHREIFFSNLKKNLATAKVPVDETSWNKDPEAFLGPNYKSIVSLIDIFSLYDSRELYQILSKSKDFRFVEQTQTKPLESDPKKQVLKRTIGQSFLNALQHPNDLKYSSGLDADLIPYLDEKLFPRAADLIGRIGMEVFEDRSGTESMMPKILTNPLSTSSQPLTLESLKSMPPMPNWAFQPAKKT
ncbi:hypothetical protein M1328_00625 [Patescibacteria group bacterium]|nr:hypothetical protein [Patescibacteria group bacterium]